MSPVCFFAWKASGSDDNILETQTTTHARIAREADLQTACLLFLIVAMTILWARTSALAAQQYHQLAARIGIPAGTWRS